MDHVLVRPTVLVAYQNTASYRLAMRYCESSTSPAQVAERPATTAWKFEMLASRGLSAIAAKEAQAARLVILALDGFGELPGHVKSWMTTWCATTPMHPSTLAVVAAEGLDLSGGWPEEAFLRAEAARGARRLVLCVAGRPRSPLERMTADLVEDL